MASTPRLAPGTSFAGDFRVLGPLAEGGMGSVYRAEQLSTHKLRALKIVHGRLLDDERSRARFLREATIGASIASEHVVEVISAGIDAASETPYIVMELLDGADLATVLRHRVRLGVDELAAVMRQLCHGMGAAHDVRVVHRDLKPENIFIAYPRHAGATFTIKILDFGIARIAQESKAAATLTGSVGSPLWMAPEQINGEAIIPSTDVWALGLLAYWMLVGQPYWRTARSEGLTVQALFVEQLFRPLDAPSVRAAEVELGHAIPPGFDDWFAACVARSPAERFTDANAAGSAFAQAVDPGLDGTVSLLPPRDQAWAAQGTRRLSVVEVTAAENTGGERDSHGHGEVSDAAIDLFSPTVAGTVDRPTPTMSAPVSTAPAATSAPTSPGVRRQWPYVLGPALVVSLGGTAWWSSQRPPEPSNALVEVEPAPPELVAPEPVPAPHPEPASGEPAPSAPNAADATSDGDDGDHGDDGDDGDDGPDPWVEHGPLVAVRPMATQLSFSMAELTMLGWTADGSRFVIDATYPDRDGLDGPVTRLRLVQVHDALTGAMIASYVALRENTAAAPSHDRLMRAALEAEPLDEWTYAREQLALVAPEPHRHPSDSRARIEGRIDAVPEGTTMVVEDTPGGLHFRWTVGPLPLVAAEPLTPRIHLRWAGDGHAWDLLDVSFAIHTDELVEAALPDGEPPVYEGDVTLYHSPDDDRVLVVVTAAAEHVSEPERMFDTRWFLRANGPQIRLVDAGIGERRLRVVADRLARGGLPIAAAELDSEASASTQIYARARDPEAAGLADRINETLGTDYPSALLERAGWTQVVVVLGQDGP